MDFTGRIKPKRDRVTVHYRKGFEADPAFLEIWEKLKGKTTYRVKYDTAVLIQNAAKAVKGIPVINAPSVRSVKTEVILSNEGVSANYKGDKLSNAKSDYVIPDYLNYIQNRTELTRSTIYEILNRSGRLQDMAVNPQLFMDYAVSAIRRVLYDLMIDGIEYRRISGAEYEMRLFKDSDLEIYLNDFTFKVNQSGKTIYENYIPLDSTVESRFAQDCENSDQIKFYFKLPEWFKIPTPIGSYNPDWAVVFEDDKRIYFVAETKDTGTPTIDLNKLHPSEKQKIKCGIANFRIIDGIEYRVVKKVSDLID